MNKAMENKGMTITIVTEAQSLNYGEGIGNVTGLKRMSRANGMSFTYLSRQGLVNELKRLTGIDVTNLSLDGSVIQFAPEATIADFAEIDLFGYMKTTKPAKTRSAVVRVSHMISLESFNADIDFLTNKGLLDRYNETAKEKKDGGNISQSEIHKSFYVYTISVDLDKVGIDKNDNIEISKEEKAKRVKNLLNAIKFLSRDIRGRRENLSPIFAIGGVYNLKNPFFENRVKLKEGNAINTLPLLQTMNLDDEVKNNTKVGLIKGILSNDEELESKLNVVEMQDLFRELSEKVDDYYGV